MATLTPLPSNSNLSKRQEQKNLKKVTKGHVTTQKQSVGKKLAKNFLSEDISDVKNYVLTDVVLPAIFDLIRDAVTTTVDMCLPGGKKSSRSYSSNKNSMTAYYNMSSPKNRQPASPAHVKGYEFDDIIFETRAEAEEVLTNLIEAIDVYGSASVLDLYDLAGLDGHGRHTDNNYGWTNLSRATSERVRGGGYILNLPKARPI